MGEPEVQFTVYGVPMAKGSGSRVAGGRYIEDGTPKSRKAKTAWGKAIQDMAETLSPVHADALSEGPLYVGAVFYFPRPKSHQRLKKQPVYHTNKPDCDKLQRALGDPLVKGKLIKDDCRIARWLNPTKLYTDDEPRVEVVIGKLWDAP